MPRQPKEYKRLPGKKRGFLAIHTLWLGLDHLLSVSHRLVVEEYKRFYFGDIQAFIIQKNNKGPTRRIILAVLTAICLIAAWQAGYGFRIFFIGIAGIFFFYTLIDILMGPTCTTWVQTAVQTEKLASLHRLRTARKALDRIRPLIADVQGRVTLQDTERYTNKPSQALSAGSPGARNLPAPRHEAGRYHQVLFILLIIDGLFTLSEFFFRHPVAFFFGSLVAVAIMVIVIIALVKQNESDMDRSVTRLTWAALVYNILMFANGYVINIVMAVENPAAAHSQLSILKMMAETAPTDSAWMFVSYLFSGGASLVLGLIGLTILGRHRRTYQPIESRTAPSAEPPPVVS